MYLKSAPKCFYDDEGIKNVHLVTYKIQYSWRNCINYSQSQGNPYEPTDTKKTQDDWFLKKPLSEEERRLKIGHFE